MKMTGLQLADQMGHYQQEEGEEDEAVEEVLGPQSEAGHPPPQSYRWQRCRTAWHNARTAWPLEL